MTPDILIARIEAFAKSRNIAPATVTSRAVENSRLYDRLKQGGSCTLKVAAQVEEFIRNEESGGRAIQHGKAPALRKGTAA